MVSNLPELLTVAEVAELFKVAPKRVREWIDDGHLLAIRTPGGPRAEYRIRKSEVERMLGEEKKP